MNLVITPLTREETADMPRFNNLEAHLNDSIFDRIGNIGNDIYNRVENVYETLQKTKEELKQLDELKETDINNPNYQPPTTTHKSTLPLLIGAGLVLGSFYTWKHFTAKKGKK